MNLFALFTSQLTQNNINHVTFLLFINYNFIIYTVLHNNHTYGLSKILCYKVHYMLQYCFATCNLHLLLNTIIYSWNDHWILTSSFLQNTFVRLPRNMKRAKNHNIIMVDASFKFKKQKWKKNTSNMFNCNYIGTRVKGKSQKCS